MTLIDRIALALMPRYDAAHCRLDQTLDDAGLPLDPYAANLHARAVGQTIARRKATVTDGLRAYLRGSAHV